MICYLHVLPFRRKAQLETIRKENEFLALRLAEIERDRQKAVDSQATLMPTPRGRTHPKVEDALWSLLMSTNMRFTDLVACINRLWEVSCAYYHKKGVMPPGDLRRQVCWAVFNHPCVPKDQRRFLEFS